MKNLNTKKIALYLFMLMSSAHVFAHAIFIKTEEIGKKNKAQDITVFYAEPSDAKRELIKYWWSNTSDFTLWLTQPDGKKTQLKITPEKDCFTASFTPLNNGVYSLVIQHAAKDIAGETQYEFNTSKLVVVGKEIEFDSEISGLIMFKKEPYKTKRNKNASVQLFDNNQPLANTKITVFSPNGWEKQLKQMRMVWLFLNLNGKELI